MPSFTGTYKIFPLGDTALTIEWGNQIDESVNGEVISRCLQLENCGLPGIIEYVPAYCSLTVYYDLLALNKFPLPGQTVQAWVEQQIRKLLGQKADRNLKEERVLMIPVCYDPEFAKDLSFLLQENKLTHEELVTLHTAKTYKVYMLGFLPGFAYMGEVDERLVIPRKPQPVPTRAGSVGIAGKQTGIYPMDSPGGWQIIGRTPWQLFDKEREEPALMRPGDSVQFYAISKKEFEEFRRMKG